ncbi:MAG: S41 family peptidase [Ferruginibacter sp.]
MMRNVFILLLSFLTLKGSAQSSNYDPDKLYAVTALKKDLQFVKSKLEKYHPNLYLYTSKETLDIFFDSLTASITRPMTDFEFYNLITLLNSKIKDGHTMFLPGDDATAYFNSKSKFFPFTVFATANSLYINMNCSSDTTLKQGTEIISINGVSAKEIMSQLLERQIRDGYNQTYPLWILNNYFKDYYSFTYGHPAEFSIVYNHNATAQQTKKVMALPRDSIKFYRLLRYPGSEDQKGITLDYNKELNSAVLTIPSFDNGILKSKYKQNFKKTVQNIFDSIQINHVAHLILDIRNNQGGDFENGQLLLANLISTPFKYLLTGGEAGIQDPVSNPYKGKLYVLINGGSFSNSGIVSSLLVSHNRGIFIGEETGGNKNIISGDAGNGSLPNTKINCEMSSKKYLIQQTDSNDGHGTIPTYSLTSTIDDIVNHKDKAKEFAFELIRKSVYGLKQ